jgi:hypothetical protein
MKNQQKKNWVMQFLVVLIAIGFYSTAQAERVDFKVDVRLNDQFSGLDVETKGKCAKKNHDGCVDVAKGTQAKFRFELKGTTWCRLQGGKKWVLGEVYLGGKNSEDKPTSWGGFEDDVEVRADFNFVNEKTGQLIKEDDSDKDTIFIFNNNNSLVPYDIWYKVTAVCTDRYGNAVGDPVETDPRIKNGGRL